MNTMTRYALVGAATTALDFALFAAGVYALGWHKLLAHAASTVVILPTSFWGMRTWAFQSSGKVTKQAAEFLTVVLTNVAVCQPLVIAITPWPMVAKAAAIVAGITWNFVGFNYVFKR